MKYAFFALWSIVVWGRSVIFAVVRGEINNEKINTMKRLIKITGITLAAVVLLLMVLPMAFKGKIEGIVKSEGNKMLNAQFDFKSLNISLIRNFPQASVTLKNFWLKALSLLL